MKPMEQSLNADALLSALAKEQQTHSTKQTNKRLGWGWVSECPNWTFGTQLGMTLTESKRKQQKAKESKRKRLNKQHERWDWQWSTWTRILWRWAECQLWWMTDDEVRDCAEIDNCNLRTTDVAKSWNAKMLTESIKSSLWWVTMSANTRDFN